MCKAGDKPREGRFLEDSRIGATARLFDSITPAKIRPRYEGGDHRHRATAGSLAKLNLDLRIARIMQGLIGDDTPFPRISSDLFDIKSHVQGCDTRRNSRLALTVGQNLVSFFG